ncbi:hypothetical protein OG948_10245 [Embleya sp. NBC_00888]|uniref:hypothetical protein n=1 Tax=Embleya sp. NBC_00888 TaxID=2975960 RepID=UPI00386555FA|nr:hypothetical protein OG948_10245 [Embleya sp. NBC_00888]
MSNNAPGPWGPPQGQPGPGQWGSQPGQGQWQQQPGPPGPFGPGPYGGPPPVPPRRQGNAGLAVAAGVVAMLVAAGVYGLIMKSLEIQSTWFGVGVAALIALAMGRIGGANPVLPVVATLLALVGVALGQLTAVALVAADELGIPVLDVVTDFGSELFRGWKEALEFSDYLVFVFAGFAAFGITKTVGEK